MKKAFLLLAVTTTLAVACNNNEKTAATGEKMAGDSTATSTAGSAADKKEQKEERNKKVIMASMDAMAAHHVNDILKDASPDCVDYGDGSMAAVKGKDSIAKMLTEYVGAFPDVKGDNLKYAADGDWVMVWGDWSGTFKNPFMGMKPTNTTFKYKDVDIFKLNDDGKILEHHNVQSGATMMMQLGVKPPKK
jgi:predicted SnoaL-like aldol condensation-catalyzing enzyme